MAKHYASGNWTVTAGREQEFIDRWLEFTGWTKANVAGALEFVLIRDVDDPRHFVSFGTWIDPDLRAAWKDGQGFAERFARCRELCEAFSGSDYTLVASPSLVR